MNYLQQEILKNIPLKLIKKINNENPIGLLYHTVSDDIIPHTQFIINHKSVKQFKDDIELLLKNYDPIDVSDIMDYMGKKNNKIFFTFDDGYREIYDVVAPILLKKGINAGIFIPLDFIDNKKLGHRNKISLIINSIINSKNKENKVEIIRNYLNLKNYDINDTIQVLLNMGFHNQELIDKIAELIEVNFNDYLKEKRPYLSTHQLSELQNKGFYIGAHSINHPYYQDLPIDEQVYQTSKSIEYFIKYFNNKLNIFALPFNNVGITNNFYNQTTKEADIVLGTRGIQKEGHKLVNRIEMENGNTAYLSLKKEYIKAIINNILKYKYVT